MERFKKLLTAIDMTEGKPWKKLVLFTLPLLVGNVFQQLYSTADAIILGRFAGDNALASVSVSMPIFNLFTVLFIGVAMGGGVMVSQYFGARDRDAISYTIGTNITLILLISIVIMIIGGFTARPLLVMLNTPPEIIDDAVLYMITLLWGVIGMAYFNILSGILRGLGDAFSPLIFLTISCTMNIVLDLVFVAMFDMGVRGVALATVTSQSFSGVLCFVRLFRMRNVFDLNLHYLKPTKKYVGQLVRLGVPGGLSQAIFAVAMMVVQPLVNSFGATFIAVNLIVMRIDGFVIMPIFSFGNAITVYTGQNTGAGKMDRVDLGTRQCCFMSVATSVVVVGAILLFGRHIAGAFTETPEVIDMAVRMLRILAAGYVALSLNMVFWGVIRGAGDATSPLWGSIINSVIIRVPAAYIMVHYMERPEALMYSMLVAWLCGTLVAIIVYRMGRWRKKSLVKAQ